MKSRVVVLVLSGLLVLLLITIALVVVSQSPPRIPTPTATVLADFVATYRETIDAINTDVWGCFNRGDCPTSTPH